MSIRTKGRIIASMHGSEESMLATVRGIVRGGTIVLEREVALPEGFEVIVSLPLEDASPELHAEFACWDQASDAAWAMIEKLESDSK